MSKQQCVLVVAAHPDDEILGCGGTLTKHAMQGDEVHIMILAEGLTSRDSVRDAKLHKKELNQLHMTSQAVASILGARSVELCNFADNRMDGVELLDVVKKVEAVIEKYKPTIVYTHHIGDVNVDHQVAHKAVVTACRPVPGQTVQKILFFETLSSTEWQASGENMNFTPNWFVDIQLTFDKKMEALRCYASEMREYPHPRSYESAEILAKYRGTMIGCHLAEAFILGRYIEIEE